MTHPLKKWRIKNGVTQVVFGEKIDLPSRFISDIECGTVYPSASEAWKIEAATKGEVKSCEIRHPRNPAVTPGLYRHYKGGVYQVLFSTLHTETGEVTVVYAPVENELKRFARPERMFFETVKLSGQPMSRFQKLTGEVNP